MSEETFFRVKKLAYHYLGYRGIEENPQINEMMEECFKEIGKISSFRYIYQEFSPVPDFLDKEPYLKYLDGSNSLILSAMTIGPMIDRQIKILEKTDISKMIVFDSMSSAYLEVLSDDFEKSLDKPLGYRFCPGYQGSKTSDIKTIHKMLNASRIGIEVLESDMMIPSKSMVGVIGINAKSKKNCGLCDKIKSCEYLKEGRKCY